MEEAIKKTEKIKNEFREKTAGYIVTALGLVVGLAWNDAISNAIKYFFPLDTNGLVAKFVYAILLTVVVVILSSWLLRVLGGNESDKK